MCLGYNSVYFCMIETVCWVRVPLCALQMEYLDSHPEVAVVGSHVEVFGPSNVPHTRHYLM